jgi:hypothetical protein
MALPQNEYTGNGSTVLYNFTFPYLDKADLRVSINGTPTTAYTLDNATTIRFNTAPANGAAIRIYRLTANEKLKAEFYPGSAIRAQDLNDDFTQILYVSQESTVEADEAIARSKDAMIAAGSAVVTANEANATAQGAAVVAVSADQKATNAVSTANTASSNASTAVSTANSASSTANAASATANGIDAKATQALNQSAAAIAAVGDAKIWQPVANVAAIPPSPAINAAIQLTDSTGVENFNPLSGKPAGFVGDNGLYVRMYWNGSTWVWSEYKPIDPDGRYVNRTGDSMSGALSWTGSSAASGTGIYSPAANTLAISTNGTGRLFVNSDGTVSVGNALTFSGATSLGLRASTNTAVGNLLVLQKSNDGTNPANIAFCKSRGTASSPTAVLSEDVSAAFFGLAFDGTTYQSIGGIKYVVQGIAGTNDVSGYITLDTRPSGVGAFTQERLRITSDGKVGVGTSSPTELLHVVGSGTTTVRAATSDTSGAAVARFRVVYPGGGGGATSAVDLRAGDGYGYLLAENNVPLLFGTNNQERLRITSDGNVGIGTASPGLPLHVIGTIGTTPASSNSGLLLLSGNSGAAAGCTIESSFTSGGYGPLLFKVNNGEAARIDSSGRLLVGTSSSVASLSGLGAQFQVNEGGGVAASLLRSTNDVSGANLVFRKTRDTTPTGATVVQSGDSLGNIYWMGTDGTNAIAAAQITVAVDGTPGANDMPGRLVFSTTKDGQASPTEALRIDSQQRVGIGKTPDNSSSNGVEFWSSGVEILARSSGTCLYVNRNTSDGTIVEIQQDAVQEGSISVSGTTVSYNGAHLSRWSQLPSGAERTEILRGSVLSNIDEMCEWGDEDNEQLNRMKVSDVEGDKNVSGVFQAWDDDDDTYTDDFYCAMTGDFIIRIGAGVTVERGDLLMSAGDGTAKPQDDDIIRSKTIAKVTSTNVSCTYDDGSYCVPCVLMAC